MYEQVDEVNVYKLVQHFAFGCTLKVNSDLLQWRPPPSSGKTIPQTQKKKTFMRPLAGPPDWTVKRTTPVQTWEV